MVHFKAMRRAPAYSSELAMIPTACIVIFNDAVPQQQLLIID